MSIAFIPPGGLWFPNAEEADADGLLAFGGDLSSRRLVQAYAKGIFPWYGQGDPILWWSPDPRLVLLPDELHVPRSLRRVINGQEFSVSVDGAFYDVIQACAGIRRNDGPGTWLLPEMIEAYTQLHRQGVAHSIEAWVGNELAGGLYGVAVGRAFFGESMFFLRPNASKVAFVWLARLLRLWGYKVVDCQQTTAHMLRFGAREVHRGWFLDQLKDLCLQTPAAEAWQIPQGFDPLTVGD